MDAMYLYYLFAGLCCLVTQVACAEQKYQRVARDLHNQYRRKHNANPLTASDELNNRAIRCAKYYAAKGTIDHTCPYKNGAGENLWTQTGGSPSSVDAARKSTISWYGEVKHHNFNGEYRTKTGHFTQLVWKSSKRFGFGIGRSNNMIVGCALYGPHGNIKGQFRRNVQRS